MRPPADEEVLEPEEAARVIKRAPEAVAVGIERRVGLASDNAAEILGATAMLARDPGLIDGAIAYASAGKGPASAIDAATQEYVDQFVELGGYFAERATGLRDVGDRSIAFVLGVRSPGIPELDVGCIFVALDVAPAETATLDRSKVIGIVSPSMAGAPATRRSLPRRGAFPRPSRSLGPPASPRAHRSSLTERRVRSISTRQANWSTGSSSAPRGARPRSPAAAALA